MIVLVNDNVDKVLQYLEDNYKREEKVYMHIVESADSIETPEGIGFGVFDVEHQQIYVAADIEEAEINVPMSIAHEYKHFLQWCEGKPFDDVEAEEFAQMVVREIELV